MLLGTLWFIGFDTGKIKICMAGNSAFVVVKFIFSCFSDLNNTFHVYNLIQLEEPCNSFFFFSATRIVIELKFFLPVPD